MKYIKRFDEPVNRNHLVRHIQSSHQVPLPVQQTGKYRHRVKEFLENPRLMLHQGTMRNLTDIQYPIIHVARVGLERPEESPMKVDDSENSGADSGALVDNPSRLAEIVTALGNLSATDLAAVGEMLERSRLLAAGGSVPPVT